MISGFRDPFEALFAMQKALESRFASDWMGGRTPVWAVTRPSTFSNAAMALSR